MGGAGVPSDQRATGIMKIVSGSGTIRCDVLSTTGEAGTVCAPARSVVRAVGCRSVEHQVRQPRADAVAEIAVLRHHIGHGAWLGQRQLLIGDGDLEAIEHL